MPRRAFWGLSDQAISGATNFGLAVLVARSVSPTEFGAFAFVFALYLLVGGISQGLSGIPLSVGYSSADIQVFRVQAGKATGAALLFGVAGGLASIAASLVAPAVVGRSILALGLCLPGLMLQDAWRFVFVAQGRPSQATINDGLWLLLQAIGFAVILTAGLAASALGWLLVWGIAATAAAVLGCLQFGEIPQVSQASAWIREHLNLISRYSAEAVVVRGSSQVVLLSVSAAAGLASAGALRGAQVLFSPLNSVYLGGLFVAVPEGARLLRQGSAALTRFIRFVTAATLVVTVAWGILAVVVPNWAGMAILGPSWPAAQPLLLPMSVQYLFIASTMGAQVGLRALAAAESSLRVQVAQAFALIAGGVIGAIHSGAHGAAVGIAAGTAISALIWWRSYRARTREGQSGSIERSLKRSPGN